LQASTGGAGVKEGGTVTKTEIQDAVSDLPFPFFSTARHSPACCGVTTEVACAGTCAGAVSNQAQKHAEVRTEVMKRMDIFLRKKTPRVGFGKGRVYITIIYLSNKLWTSVTSLRLSITETSPSMYEIACLRGRPAISVEYFPSH
jgi:hypothetical protein